MRVFQRFLLVASLIALPFSLAQAQAITAAGQPAQLDVRVAGKRSIRVTLKPLTFTERFPEHPAIARRPYPAPGLTLREIAAPVQRKVGAFTVEAAAGPLTLTVRSGNGRVVQRLTFEDDGNLSFMLDEHPVLGMGEGGPRPPRGANWREQPVQFDRRGRSTRWNRAGRPTCTARATRWRCCSAPAAGACSSPHPGSRSTCATPDRGLFLPWKPTDADRIPQNEQNQQQALGKGLPPPECDRSGLVRLFVFDAQRPAGGARGLRRHHRPGRDAAALGARLHAVAPHARRRRADACNRRHVPQEAHSARRRDLSRHRLHPERLEHAAAVVRLQPRGLQARPEGRARRHARPERQGRRPHGAVGPRPAADAARHRSRRGPARTLDASHIQSYWQQHVPLVKAGDRRVLARRGRLVQSLRAHQAAPALLPGPALHRPNVRPWSLQRNGYPGIAQWGGWVWSGDTDSHVEDARGADRGRPQPLAQHRPVLGLRHRRLLSEPRAHRRALRPLVSVRGLLRLVPLARPHVADAPAVGLGPQRHGASREQQHELAGAAGPSAQHPRIGAEQPGDRAGRAESTPSCAIS